LELDIDRVDACRIPRRKVVRLTGQLISVFPMPCASILRLSRSGGAAYAPFHSLRIVVARTEGDQMSQFIHSRLLAAALLLSGGFALATSAAASDVDAAGYYQLRCASCHGPNGEGTRHKSPSLGPPLRGNPLVINAPAELLAKIIRHGRGGQQRVYDDAYPNMPAFDAGMVPDVIGLAIYLKTVLQQDPAATAATSQTKGVSQ
jgi:mono/diheme cytochrome c family protein